MEMGASWDPPRLPPPGLNARTQGLSSFQLGLSSGASPVQTFNRFQDLPYDVRFLIWTRFANQTCPLTPRAHRIRVYALEPPPPSTSEQSSSYPLYNEQRPAKLEYERLHFEGSEMLLHPTPELECSTREARILGAVCRESRGIMKIHLPDKMSFSPDQIDGAGVFINASRDVVVLEGLDWRGLCAWNWAVGYRGRHFGAEALARIPAGNNPSVGDFWGDSSRTLPGHGDEEWNVLGKEVQQHDGDESKAERYGNTMKAVGMAIWKMTEQEGDLAKERAKASCLGCLWRPGPGVQAIGLPGNLSHIAIAAGEEGIDVAFSEPRDLAMKCRPSPWAEFLLGFPKLQKFWLCVDMPSLVGVDDNGRLRKAEDLVAEAAGNYSALGSSLTTLPSHTGAVTTGGDVTARDDGVPSSRSPLSTFGGFARVHVHREFEQPSIFIKPASYYAVDMPFGWFSGYGPTKPVVQQNSYRHLRLMVELRNTDRRLGIWKSERVRLRELAKNGTGILVCVV